MAPNRKNIAVLELPTDVASQLTVQPKFLPLTDPREQQQHEEARAEPQQQKPSAEIDSASYWDWPADTEAAVQDKKPSMEHLFTTAHLEANLIKDSRSNAAAAPSKLVAAHDDYWCDDQQQEEEQQPTVSTQPQHHSNVEDYWMMPANRTAFKEQVAERLTSAAHMEDNLRVAAASAVDTPSHTNPAHDAYWTWNSEQQQGQIPAHDSYWQWDTLTPEQEQQRVLANIVESERARQLLTADHIEKQLMAGMNAVCNKNVIVSAAPAEAGYWDM